MILRNTLRLSLALAALLFVSQGHCRAGVALTAFSGHSTFGSFDNTNQTIGWQFSTSTTIDVTHLGFWDASPGNPLGQTHQVGLWTGTGTLLASTTVLTTSALTGDFRYESIAPVTLGPGTYLIGAEIKAPFLDFYATFATSITTAPEITHLGDARNASGGGFSSPGIVTTNEGRFGPNFQFNVNSVPEPGSLTLLGLGSMSFAAYALRRRAAARAKAA
jgi:hypothetical protein